MRLSSGRSGLRNCAAVRHQLSTSYGLSRTDAPVMRVDASDHPEVSRDRATDLG